MIGMYGSSPKVKYREGMCGAFQWIAELHISSRDRVSISSGARKPRSCVDFAEIVCRFRQVIDWGTLEIGSDFRKSSPRWRIVGREEIEEMEEMEEDSTEIG